MHRGRLAGDGSGADGAIRRTHRRGRIDGRVDNLRPRSARALVRDRDGGVVGSERRGERAGVTDLRHGLTAAPARCSGSGASCATDEVVRGDGGGTSRPRRAGNVRGSGHPTAEAKRLRTAPGQQGATVRPAWAPTSVDDTPQEPTGRRHRGYAPAFAFRPRRSDAGRLRARRNAAPAWSR